MVTELRRCLIAVALYPSEPTLHALTEAALQALIAPENAPAGWAVDLLLQDGDDPGQGHYANLRDKHNRARQEVLAGGYDALLSIEADMVPPAETLTRLLAVDADVAYGLYCARSTGMWLLFTALDARHGTSIVAHPEQAAAVFGQVVASQGAGMGCTLIHRHVLEQVAFRLDDALPFADDWPFAMDVAAAGLRQAHDTGLLVGHVREGGVVLYPDVRREEDADGEERWVFVREERIEAAGGMEAARGQAAYLVLRTLYLAGANRYAGLGETVMLGEDAARILMRRQAVTPATPAAEKGPAPRRGRRNGN